MANNLDPLRSFMVRIEQQTIRAISEAGQQLISVQFEIEAAHKLLDELIDITFSPYKQQKLIALEKQLQALKAKESALKQEIIELRDSFDLLK